MEKLLFAFLISIISGFVCTLLGVAVSLRAFTAIFFGLTISDVILMALYSSEIISNSNNPDLVYVFFYILGSVIVILSSGLYTLIRSNSSRCVCRCCRNYDYEELFNQ